MPSSSLFFNGPPTTDIYTLSLHDALPICMGDEVGDQLGRDRRARAGFAILPRVPEIWNHRDRKSTRLNSSHMSISYAVFCLKKKKKSYTQHSPYCRYIRYSTAHPTATPPD